MWKLAKKKEEFQNKYSKNHISWTPQLRPYCLTFIIYPINISKNTIAKDYWYDIIANQMLSVKQVTNGGAALSSNHRSRVRMSTNKISRGA